MADAEVDSKTQEMCTYPISSCTVIESETRNEEGSTPAITATAIVAGLAFLVLIVLVTALLWRRIKRKHKFKLRQGDSQE